MKTRQSKNIDISNSKLIALVSKNVKRIRLENDISQETLAELSSLHRNSICLIENGQTNVTLTTIENIAQALNVNIIDLLQK